MKKESGISKGRDASGFLTPFFMFGSRIRAPFATQLIGNPVPMIRIILFGTAFLISGFSLILATSVFLAGNWYALPRLAGLIPVLLYVAVIAALYRRGKYGAVSWMLVGFYALLGFVTLLLWGINAPTGLLILSFVILLAGVTRGARAILPTTLGVCLVIAGLHLLAAIGAVAPDTSMLSVPSTYVDVTTYAVVFVIIATVSWLYGRRMEQALSHALRAEADLQKEKSLLAVRLEEKTREVRAAQLEEMRGLYRFAELGQLGTVMLHDLANNLTALTLDIDDIERRNKRSQSITRARESITYLENLIHGVRERIRADDEPRAFDAVRAVFDVVTELGRKARRADVILEYDRHRKTPFTVMGDPLRLSHALTIVISNAIEAYAGAVRNADTPVVRVAVTTAGKKLFITVTDRGIGIPSGRRGQLFQPFSSTKPDGMGIGLFMAKEMIERHFGGTVVLQPGTDETTFIITLVQAADRTRKG